MNDETIQFNGLECEPTDTNHAPAKRLIHGDELLWLGTPYRLIPSSATTEPHTGNDVAGGTDRHVLHVPVCTPEVMLSLVVQWYQRRGSEWSLSRASRYPHPSHAGLRFTIHETGTQVALYEPCGYMVWLHWSVFQLPTPLVECALVCELARATRPGGLPRGPEWRQQMDIWMWDWRARETQLNEKMRRAWRGHLIA